MLPEYKNKLVQTKLISGYTIINLKSTFELFNLNIFFT